MTLEAFAASLEAPRAGAPAQFCHGESCTLADVHAGPFLYRFGAVLGHYRGFDLAGRHPRLGQVVAALEQLPEWDAVLCAGGCPRVTGEVLARFYEQYANNMQWGTGADGTPELAGRGAHAVDSKAG